MQGQKTFDEIRKKYRGDREFKQPWTAISASSSACWRRSRAAIAAGLGPHLPDLRDGKVYTMLAHAAGRFGE